MTTPTRFAQHTHTAPWAIAPHVDKRLTALMVRTVHEVAGPLAEPLLRIVGAAGKRLRPALTLAVAERGGHRVNGGAHSGPMLQLAAAIELLHCATLVHDDLIDAAPTRRGVPTLNANEGAATAIVGGDLLIAAATLLAGQVSQRAGLVIAQTFAGLCRGEALQAQTRYDVSASMETLIDVAKLKTGSLLEGACLLGADAADAEPPLREAAASFGMSFGVCLQLVDDVLDIASTPALAGKPVGADFLTGTLTVPAALAMAESPALADLLRSDLDAVARRRAVNLLQHANDALATTAATARRYARDAKNVLTTALPMRGTRRGCALEEWPEAFVDAQLASKTSVQHRRLLTQPLTP